MKEWSAIGIEQKKDLLFKYNCKIHYNYEKLLKGLKEGDKISYFQLILRGTLESISLWGNEGKTDSARNDFIRNAYNYDIMSPEKNIEKLIDFFDSEDNDDTIKHFNMFSRLAVISLYTRKIDEYVSQFRKPTGRFAILRPSIAEDARALKSLAQPLGIGGYFLKRELVRLGIIDYKAIHRDCYIPSKKVCDWFGVNYSQSRIERSGAIYNKIHAIDKDFDDFAIDKLPQFDVAIRIMKEKNII